MTTGLILTMGLSPEPLVFSIKELTADYVVFIGTQESLKKSVDKTVSDSGLKPSQYDKIEIKDNPTEIGYLCEKFQLAKQWLENQGAEYIIADPTGGRKWMSAGAVMAASFLGIPMMYIDAKYLNGNIELESMKAVELGNAYDQTGFVLAGKGCDAYNVSDFEAAAIQFARITPTHAHKKALYEGLSGLCINLARWDRFEHYGAGISKGLSESVNKIESARRSGAGSEDLDLFINDLKVFCEFISSIEGTQDLNLNFLTDIFLNSQRCIIRNRFDDAIARQYRTLEALSQLLLKENFGIISDNPDYSVLKEHEKNEFKENCYNKELPKKIDLKLGFWLLKVLGHPIKNDLFGVTQLYKNFTMEKVLNERNESILAHGFKPIGKSKVNDFQNKLEDLLVKVFNDEFIEIKSKLSLPKMPLLGF